jgi:hypothetical protein
LVAAEAVLCAFRACPVEILRCRLSVHFTDDSVSMTLAAQSNPDAFEGVADSISRDLIGGYVRQLRGVLLAPTGAGVLTVTAPCAPLQRPADGCPAPSPSEPPATSERKFFRAPHRTHSRLAS